MLLGETKIFHFLGFSAQGDLGGWTFYTDKRGNLVFFVKSPPLEPPSYLQTHQRNRFRTAANKWRTLQPSERANWMLAAERAHLNIHGYDFYVYVQLRHDYAAAATVARQANLTLNTD